MDYQLVQYGCDECGALTPVMDPDSKLPKGWVVVTSHRHLCPECAKKTEIREKTQYEE